MIDQNKPECNHEEWIKCDGCLAPDTLNTCQKHVKTVRVEGEIVRKAAQAANAEQAAFMKPTESWEEEADYMLQHSYDPDAETLDTEAIKAFIKAQRQSEYWRGFQGGKEKIAKLLGSFNPNTHG